MKTIIASAVPIAAGPGADYFHQLRRQVRWVPVQVGERKLATPDVTSRLLLAQSAASRAGLSDVGLDFRDVYGVINAETTWVPRTGMGRNGVASHGLAQFEPATARAVGLSNPDDAVEAVHAAAVLLKEAAEWSARRIASLDLSPEVRAARLREGVSIYYNLSSRGRRTWSGSNTHQLPVETQRHIDNFRVGIRQAEQLHARLEAGEVPVTPVPAWLPPEGAAAASRPAKATQNTATRHATAPRRATQVASAVKSPPVVVTERNGRKTWVFPQGTISWTPAQNG